MSSVIRVENLSKQYRLGQVGTGTLSDDLTRLWYRFRGMEDPFAKVGQTNDRTKKSEGLASQKSASLLSRFSPFTARQSPDLVWALKDVNFEVKQGEVRGIIGRNGAGKSTLLKILARVTTPTTGSVKIKGRIASLLEVGTGFHPDLSGRENIYLNGAILGMRKHEITHKLEEIIDFSGCERYIDTPVKRYSSGMYVRLAFAVAAHLEPEILIVDEVLAVGDIEFQKKCMGKMHEVAEGGRTVLFVSHNMGAVEKLCDSGIFMANGEVIFDGEAKPAIDCYLSYLSSESIGLDNLSNETNRSGGGRIRIRKAIILNESAEEYVAIKSGGAATLEFVCENTTNDSISGVSLGYSLSNSRGDLLVIQYSDYEDQLFTLPPGLSTIVARIPLLPIASGGYSLGARLLVGGAEEDWPRYSIDTIVIEGGQYGGNSTVAHSGRGSLLLETDWHLRDSVEYRSWTKTDK